MRTSSLRYTAVLLALVPVVTTPVSALSSMPVGTAKPVMPDAEKTIRGFYARVIDTIKKRDARAAADLLDATLAPDWRGTSPHDPVTTRDVHIQFLRQHPKEAVANLGGKNVTRSIIVKRVKIDGDRAVVDAVFRETNPTLDAALQSNTSPTGRPQHRAKLTPTHDTWVRLSGAWKLQHSKTLAERFEIDGKIVKP